jgi:hypothetical protein
MSHFKKVSCLSILFFLIAGAAFAQGGTTGAISGTVQDKSGGVIAGAKVVVQSDATGDRIRELFSNSAGLFTVTLLPVGSYTLSVTALPPALCTARSHPRTRTLPTANPQARCTIRPRKSFPCTHFLAARYSPAIAHSYPSLPLPSLGIAVSDPGTGSRSPVASSPQHSKASSRAIQPTHIPAASPLPRKNVSEE